MEWTTDSDDLECSIQRKDWTGEGEHGDEKCMGQSHVDMFSLFLYLAPPPPQAFVKFSWRHYISFNCETVDIF